MQEVLKLKYFFTYVSVATENKSPAQCFMRQHCRYLLKLLVLGVTNRQIDGKNATVSGYSGKSEVRELYISCGPKWAPRNRWFWTLFMKSEVWERWISVI